MERALVLLSWWKQQEDDAYALTYSEAAANMICNPYGYSARFFPAKSTGVMGDNGVYGFAIELKGPYSYNILGELSNRIINEIRGVNRILYAVSDAEEVIQAQDACVVNNAHPSDDMLHLPETTLRYSKPRK